MVTINTDDLNITVSGTFLDKPGLEIINRTCQIPYTVPLLCQWWVLIIFAITMLCFLVLVFSKLEERKARIAYYKSRGVMNVDD